jgi:hypothetical protein
MSDVDRLFFESKAGPDTSVHLEDLTRDGRRFDTFDGLIEAVQSAQMDAFQRRRVLVEFLTSQNGQTPLNETELDQLYDEGRELSVALRQLAQGEHEKQLLQYLRHPQTNLLNAQVEENLTIVDMREFFAPGLPGEDTMKYLKDMSADKVTYRTFGDLVAAVKSAHRDHNEKLKKAKASVWTYLTDPKGDSLFGRHQSSVQPTISHTQVDALFDKGGAGLDTLKTLRLLKRARRMGNNNGRTGTSTPNVGNIDDNGFRSMNELTAAVRAVTAIEQERQRVFQFLTSPQCKLFESPSAPTLQTETSILSDSGISGNGGGVGMNMNASPNTSFTGGSGGNGDPASSPTAAASLHHLGSEDRKRGGNLLNTPQARAASRHTLGGPLASSGHQLSLSPSLSGTGSTPHSPMTPLTPSPTDTKSQQHNRSASTIAEEGDVLGELRDKENMEIIANQIRERFGPRLAAAAAAGSGDSNQSSNGTASSSINGTASSSRRPSGLRSATLGPSPLTSSRTGGIAGSPHRGLHVSTARYSMTTGERKGLHSPSASPPLSPYPAVPVIIRMEHVEAMFAEVAADQQVRIANGTTKDRGPIYPHVYGWLNDFNDASRKFTRVPDLIRALKDRAAGMDDTEYEVAPDQMQPMEHSSNLDTLMEGGVNVMPALLNVLEEVIEPNNNNSNDNGNGNINHDNETLKVDANGQATNGRQATRKLPTTSSADNNGVVMDGTNATGNGDDTTKNLSIEEEARLEAEKRAEVEGEQMDEEAKTMTHLQSLLPQLFFDPSGINVVSTNITEMINASGGLPHAARFYLSQLANACTSSIEAKANGRIMNPNDDQPQFTSIPELVAAVAQAHDGAKMVKNEMFEFLTDGGGSGLVTQKFGVVPRLTDMDRLYEEGGAGHDTFKALQALADANLEFGFLAELGAAIKAAHVGTQRQMAADKTALMSFFKDHGGNALLPSLLPTGGVTMNHVDTLYHEGEAGNESVDRLEPLLAAHRTFENITALADAIRNPDVDARRMQVEQQAAQHEREKKEVLDYLHGHDCQLFMDASDKVQVGVRDVDALFYEGGAGSATITFVKAFDFADKRFQKFPQLITAVANAHRGKRSKQEAAAAAAASYQPRAPLVVGDASQTVAALPAIVAALQRALGKPRVIGRTHSLGHADMIADASLLPGYDHSGGDVGTDSDSRNRNGSHSSQGGGRSQMRPGLDRIASHRRTQSNVPAGGSRLKSRPVSPSIRAMAHAAAAAVTTNSGSSSSLNDGANSIKPVTLPPSEDTNIGGNNNVNSKASATTIDGSPSQASRQLRRPPALTIANNNSNGASSLSSPNPTAATATTASNQSPRAPSRGPMTPRTGGSLNIVSDRRPSMGVPNAFTNSPLNGARHSRSIGRWQGLSRPVVSSSTIMDDAEADMHVAADQGLRPKSAAGHRHGSVVDQQIQLPDSITSIHTNTNSNGEVRRGSMIGVGGGSSAPTSRGSGVSFAPDTPLTRPSRGLIRARTRSLAMNSLDPNAGSTTPHSNSGNGSSHNTPNGASHARRLDAAATAYAASVAATATATLSSTDNNVIGTDTNTDNSRKTRVDIAHAALLSSAVGSTSNTNDANSNIASSNNNVLSSISQLSGKADNTDTLAALTSSSVGIQSSTMMEATTQPNISTSLSVASVSISSSSLLVSSTLSSSSSSIAAVQALPITSGPIATSTVSGNTSSIAPTTTTIETRNNGNVTITNGDNVASAAVGSLVGSRGPGGRAPLPPSSSTLPANPSSSSSGLVSSETGTIMSHAGGSTVGSSTIVPPIPLVTTSSAPPVIKRLAPSGSSASSAPSPPVSARRGPTGQAPLLPAAAAAAGETLVTMSTSGAMPSVAEQGTNHTRKPMPPSHAKLETKEEKKRSMRAAPTRSAARWAILRKHVFGGRCRKKRPQRQEVLEPQVHTIIDLLELPLLCISSYRGV